MVIKKGNKIEIGKDYYNIDGKIKFRIKTWFS